MNDLEDAEGWRRGTLGICEVVTVMVYEEDFRWTNAAFHVYPSLEYNAPPAFLSLTAPLHKYNSCKGPQQSLCPNIPSVRPVASPILDMLLILDAPMQQRQAK